VTPLLVLLAVVGIGLGRTVSTRIEVDSAARQAARAASLARDPATAITRAWHVAQVALSVNRLTCTRLEVTVDLANYRPGGTVAVTVSCTTALSDVAMPGLPGHATKSARAVSPIDPYRADPTGTP
jgi:hypothetical protein